MIGAQHNGHESPETKIVKMSFPIDWLIIRQQAQMSSGRHGRVLIVNPPMKGPSCKHEAVVTLSTSRNGSGANYSASLSVTETFVKGGDNQLARRFWVSLPPAASYASVASLPLKFLWTQQYKFFKNSAANATPSLTGLFEAGNVILVGIRGLICWKIA